jgi:putative hydrolase of the HAD superfamily
MALGGLTPVRAVLLDALGTLVELKTPWPALAEALKEERGIEITLAEAELAFRDEMAYYRSHHHEGRDEPTLTDLRHRCVEVLRGALPPEAEAAISTEELEPLMLGALRFAAYPEAPDVLRALRDRGLRLVVASNWDISLHEVLRATGLRELLDGAVTSAEVGAPKPAPEVFKAALEIAGVQADTAVHVGDTPEADVPGALAAGVAPVLLRRGSEQRDGVQDVQDPPWRSLAVPVLGSLAELPSLLW